MTANLEPGSLTIALAGNPNSGKTTIFNNITGTRQKVGNWPGVTVEKKEGVIHKYGYNLKIVDLPGTYSLTPFSIEEIVARDFILENSPDIVINIIDASNLERSLYLATQIRELDCKVIFALNMADLAQTRGIKINSKKLSDLLDVPVLFTVGNKNEGVDKLLKAAIDLAESIEKKAQKRKVKYSKDIEESILKLQEVIEPNIGEQLPYNKRWLAIKLIENDKIVKQRICEKTGDAQHDILSKADECRNYIINRYDDDPEIILTDERYGFIAGIIKEIQTISTKQRIDISRNIDLVLTNRFLGFPIFFFFIWAMFQLTFSLGVYPMDWIDQGIGLFSTCLDSILPDSLIKDLVLNGIIAGVGSIIIFLPNILILFFCIALFEDTGYMARAAFLMDRIMHLIGLHGKSFIPMLMGFGCNVPAIMAARTLESEKDRILTILITPFMSCSARLPIYIVLAGTFFAEKAGTVIFIIYFIGVLLSIISGRLFRATLLKGEDAPFVMELPPYRVPMAKSLFIHMWDRSKMFLKKMGSVIFVGSIIIWMLSAFPRNINYSIDYDLQATQIDTVYQEQIKSAPDTEKKQLEINYKNALNDLERKKSMEHIEKSYMGHIGKIVAPVFEPIGIDWRGSIALLTGFVAKEIVVSTLGVLYAADESESGVLEKALKSSGMTTLSAFSMMIFVLLYIPCFATVVVIKKETGSFKWTLFSVAYSTLLAWILAFVIYQGGIIMGIGVG